MIFKFLMRIVSILFSLVAFLIYTAIIYIFFIDYFSTNFVITLLLSLVITSVVIWFFRIFFRKERPNKDSIEKALLKHGKGAIGKLKEKFLQMEARSFASAHVARTGAFGYLFYFYNGYNIWVLVVFFCAALLAGISRVVLERHTKFDVIIGLIIGILSGYVSKLILGL